MDLDLWNCFGMEKSHSVADFRKTDLDIRGHSIERTNAELQIRGGNKDNATIIFLISQQKHTL